MTLIANLPPADRHAHVSRRALERGQLIHTPELVAALEEKIRGVRTRIGQGTPVAPILPTKIGEDKARRVQFYRVLHAGHPHTYVWSLLAKGLISYIGPGEIPAGIRPPKVLREVPPETPSPAPATSTP